MHAHVPVLTAFASSLPPQAARLSFTSCCWVHMDVVVACALCQSNPFCTLGPERLSVLWLTFPEALAWGITEQTEGQLLRDRGLEVARQLPVRKHRVLGMNQRTAVALSREVLSLARALLLSRFSSERSEHPLVWGDGFLPSTALKYKGRWGVGRPTEGKLCARCSHPRRPMRSTWEPPFTRGC